VYVGLFGVGQVLPLATPSLVKKLTGM